MRNYTQKGITMVEIMIVIGVVAILFALTLPEFSKIRERQVLKAAVADVLSSVDKARGQTLASLNASEYGVHFQADQIVLFKGTSYSSGASDNESLSIASPASITNVTFGGSSGTSGDVYFNRLSGAPSTTGTVTVSSTNYSKIVTISATGVASSN